MKYELKQVLSDKLPGGMAYFLVEVTEGYDLIQVKRGLRADLDSIDLQVGEPAFCYDTHEFFVGGPDGQKWCINNGGSTADYATLYNKPKINNVTLDGNKSWADLGLSNPMHIAGRVDTYQDLPATANDGDVYLVGLISDTEKAEYVYISGDWEYLGTSAIEVDSELSTTSENPVQNKVITEALNAKQPTIDSSHKLDADLIDDSSSTNKLCHMDANGNIFIGATQITQLIDRDSYDALVTKENRFYLIYPTPSNNGGV